MFVESLHIIPTYSNKKYSKQYLLMILCGASFTLYALQSGFSIKYYTQKMLKLFCSFLSFSQFSSIVLLLLCLLIHLNYYMISYLFILLLFLFFLLIIISSIQHVLSTLSPTSVDSLAFSLTFNKMNSLNFISYSNIIKR